MRQLKFRVWTGIEMVHDVTVGKFGNFYVNPGDKGDGLDPKDTASLTSYTTKYHENYPVMQFTGLLDKSGKEIYECDILKTYPILASDLIGKKPFNVIVRFEKSCWLSNGILGDYQASVSEIIGNVYQNSELLKP